MGLRARGSSSTTDHFPVMGSQALEWSNNISRTHMVKGQSYMKQQQPPLFIGKHDISNWQQLNSKL
jgi:hypothetical protein